MFYCNFMKIRPQRHFYFKSYLFQKKFILGIFPLAIFAMLLNGCGHGGRRDGEKLGGGPVYYALAEIKPTQGNKVYGRVWFSEAFGKVKVDVQITGLDKNSKHGFHIHEFGDCSAADASSAGGHYNPENHEHAGLDQAVRHAGDFGNLVTDKEGVARLNFDVTNLSINGALNPIIGRGVIVHKNSDDYVTQPTGGAGARIACGVIGAATRANDSQSTK